MSNYSYQVTEYKGISGIYFKKLLKEVIKIGNLNSGKYKILDFGAGHGILKKMLKKENSEIKVINYDVIDDLTDIKDWRSEEFDTVVANEVFCTFTPDKLNNLIKEFQKKKI